MTARATPSILSKGFFWFLFCSQREAQEFKRFKSSRGKSVQSVVEEKNLSMVENKDSTLPILNDDESDYRYEDIDSSLP